MTAATKYESPLESGHAGASRKASVASLAAAATVDPSSPLVVLLIGGPSSTSTALEDLLGAASAYGFRFCRCSHSPDAIRMLKKGGFDCAVVFDDLAGRAVLRAGCEQAFESPLVMIFDEVESGSRPAHRTRARLAGAVSCLFASELSGPLAEAALLHAIETHRLLAEADRDRYASRAREPLSAMVAAASLDAHVQVATRRAEVDRHYRVAAVFIAVQRFKGLEDVLGPEDAGAVRSGFAHRVIASAGSRALCSHYEDDAFVVILEGYDTQDEDLVVVERLRSAVNEPFSVGDDPLYLDVAIGVGRVRGLGSTDPIARAKFAARQGPAALVRPTELSGSHDRGQSFAAAGIESRLQQALDRDEFAMRYQPVVELENGRLLGFEALIRWHAGGSEAEVAAADFIPAANDGGLIIPIGYWAIETAVRQMIEWDREFELGGGMAIRVNLSPGQVADKLMVERLRSLLLTTGLSPRSLKLEVPLPVASASSQARALIEAAADHGIGVWIEGISDARSPRCLEGLPVEGLKIGRNAVAAIDGSEGGAKPARAIVDAARDMGAEVIATGVENRLQANYLRWLGCHTGQGFLYAPPLAVGDAYAHIARS